MPTFVNTMYRHRLSVATLASDVASPSKPTAAKATHTQQQALYSAQLPTHALFAPHPHPHRPPPPRFQHRPPAASYSTEGHQTRSHALGNVADTGVSAWPNAFKQQQQQLLHPLLQQQLQQQQQQQQQRQQQVASAAACLSAKPVLHSFGQRQTAEQSVVGQQSCVAAAALPAQTHSNAARSARLHAQTPCQRDGHTGDAGTASSLQGSQLPGQLPLQLPLQLPAQLPQDQQGHLHPQSSVQQPSHDSHEISHPHSLLRRGQLPPAGKNHATIGKQAAATAAAPAAVCSSSQAVPEQQQGSVQLQLARTDGAARQSVAVSKVQNSAPPPVQLKQQVSFRLVP